MRVNKCDYCGTETLSTAEWFELSIPWPDRQGAAERGFVMLGKEEKEFCSAPCVVKYLQMEDEDGQGST